MKSVMANVFSTLLKVLRPHLVVLPGTRLLPGQAQAANAVIGAAATCKTSTSLER